MEYLLGIIVALVGGLFFYKTKAKSAEALLENSDLKDKINTNNVEASKKQGQLEAEKAKVIELFKDADKKKASDVKPDDFN